MMTLPTISQDTHLDHLRRHFARAATDRLQQALALAVVWHNEALAIHDAFAATTWAVVRTAIADELGRREGGGR